MRRRRSHTALALLVIMIVLGATGCGILPGPAGEPEIGFWASEEVVPPGGCAMLHWEVRDAEDFPVFLNGGEVPPEGEEEVCLEEPTTFELVVGAPGGSIRETVTIIVEGEPPPEEPPPGEPPPEEPPPQEPPPEEPGPEGEPEVVMLVVDPDAIPQGACAMLHWEVHPPEWPVLLNGQEVPPIGEREECPQATTTYELHVEAPGGPHVSTITLHVEAPPEPEPTPQPPGPTPTSSTAPPPPGPTPQSPPPPPAPSGADVWPSDLYPASQPQGVIWVRVVNNGPATLTNKKVRISGSVTRLTRTTPPSASGHNILPQDYTINLAPGQQQNINWGEQIDLNQYNYDFTVTVAAVDFTDPNTGNNSYSESFQPTMANLVLHNNGAANICYVHFVLSPAGANNNWGGDQLGGGSCIFPGGTSQWQILPGTYDLAAFDGTHQQVLGQRLAVNIAGTYDWYVP